MGGCNRDAQAGPIARLAAGKRVHAGLERRVGGKGEVEPLAHPVRVDAHERAVRVEERAPGGSRRQRGGVLQRPGDAPPAGATEGPFNGRDEPERDARPAGRSRCGRKDRGADRGAPRRPGDRRDVRRVDLHDGEIAVPVDALGGAAGDPAVGEPDGHLRTAQVVGVGEDAAVADDDAGAAEPGTDPDDGRADGACDGGDGFLELFKDGHGDECLAFRVVTCDLQSTT